MPRSINSFDSTLEGHGRSPVHAPDKDNNGTAAAPSGTKQDLVLSMLRRPDGVTIATVMAATGWQAHSVRGFFAGVVRKKLGLSLTSEMGNSGRVYRSVTPKPAKARSKKTRAELSAAE